jgi:hypothetical protein
MMLLFFPLSNADKPKKSKYSLNYDFLKGVGSRYLVNSMKVFNLGYCKSLIFCPFFVVLLSYDLSTVKKN